MLNEHLADAAQELNYLQSSWSNRSPPNLWTVELVSVPLIESQTTYSVDASTVMILDAYIEYGDPPFSRILFPMSRTEYASQPNKDSEGVPSNFWFDRLLSPTITLWLVPDASATYTLKYYRCTQNQDANLPSGQTPAVPYRFFDAMIADLAYRLARIYAPELEDKRKVDAMDAWNLAASADTENVNLYLTPSLFSYYR